MPGYVFFGRFLFEKKKLDSFFFCYTLCEMV